MLSSAGGTGINSQMITTKGGYVHPINVKNGLPFVLLRPYTDQEWIDLPHESWTREGPWDPSCLDVITHESSGQVPMRIEGNEYDVPGYQSDDQSSEDYDTDEGPPPLAERTLVTNVSSSDDDSHGESPSLFHDDDIPGLLNRDDIIYDSSGDEGERLPNTGVFRFRYPTSNTSDESGNTEMSQDRFKPAYHVFNQYYES